MVKNQQNSWKPLERHNAHANNQNLKPYSNLFTEKRYKLLQKAKK